MTPLATLNPFSQQDIALAQAIVSQADQLLAFYGKCTNCGLDVSALVAQVQAQKEFAAAVIKEFGSGATNV